MTPAIYFSDLHIDDYKTFSSNRDRLEDCLLVLDDVYKIAVKRGAKIILFSGDLFNTPKFLYTKVLTKTIERLGSLIKANPEIIWYVITGNHDFATKNLPTKPTVSALQHLATIFPDNFILIDNKTVITGVFGEDSSCAIIGIPNYEFKEHFQQKLAEAAEKAKILRGAKKANLQVTLMIHQSPEGQYNTNVRTNTSPSDPLYKEFDMVLCGDIHTSQRITDAFLIGGNPLHKDRGDEGKEKGIYVIDLENPTAIEFKSRKGRYPEFKSVRKGDVAMDDPNNFIVHKAEISDSSTPEDVAVLNEFGSTLPKEELITNYWKSEGSGDKELLKVGLSFLSK